MSLVSPRSYALTYGFEAHGIEYDKFILS
jgi:hypothetical protein